MPLSLSAKAHFKNADFTVDWFHMVQLFTRAVGEVLREEAIAELVAMDFYTSTAWRIKEALRWIRKVLTAKGAKRRLSSFLNFARELIGKEVILTPARKAVNTVEKYRDAVVVRWRPNHSNNRIEGLNSLFRAAKARVCRNDLSFVSIVYLIGASLQDQLQENR